jgi:Spy/CpxP family protein refolding chaperone
MKRCIAAAVAIGVLAAGAGVTSAQTPGPAKQARETPQRHTWWNDPNLVRELSLGADQRAKMDAAYQRLEQGLQRDRPKGMQGDFYAALEAGDWDRARSQLAAVPKTLPNPVHPMLEQKLAVVQLLTDEQRRRLAAERPDLLRRHWNPRPAWTAPQQRSAPRPAQ